MPRSARSEMKRTLETPNLKIIALSACISGLIIGNGAIAADATAAKTAKPAPKPHPSTVQVKDVAGLPRVLLIGDSVSMGYTIPVRKLLDGKANVHRPPLNCHSSRQILSELDDNLGNKPWDVIHLNCGAHDYSYRTDGTGSYLPPPQGKIHVPLDEYQKNLRAIVKRLKQTNARLIWATTTPMGAEHVKKGYRTYEEQKAYGDTALAIMKEEGVAVDDLYGLTKSDADTLLRPGDGVHFTNRGYDELAKHVAAAVQKELPKTKND